MVNYTITFFAMFLILCHKEYVKSYKYPPAMRNCLNTISRDFGWNRKKNKFINKTVTSNALKEKNINNMHGRPSILYFEYLKNEIKVDKTIMETPIQFCQNNTRYIPRSEQIEGPIGPAGRVYYLKVVECLNQIADYFLCTGSGILGKIVSDNKLEIAKDLFYNRREFEFELLDETHHARRYYNKIISLIKFNDNFMEPRAFCLSIGPAKERESVEWMDKLKLFNERYKASSSRPNQPQTNSSSEEED